VDGSVSADFATVSVDDGLDAMRSAILKRLRAQLSLIARGGNAVLLKLIKPAIDGGDPRSINTAFMAGVWSLVADGIIIPGESSTHARADDFGNEVFRYFNYFSVTPYGVKVLSQTGVVDPHDRESYLTDARARLGDADEVIFTYLAEASKSFADANYLSATVMLGVSAEGLMKWLIARFLEHLPSPQRERHRETMAKLSNRTEKLFTTFVNDLQSHYEELSPDLKYQAAAYLDQLNSIIRVNRDDVAHGRAARVDRQLAYGNLTLYPTLLTLTRELANALLSANCSIYAE
jgi:hypothetical protein